MYEGNYDHNYLFDRDLSLMYKTVNSWFIKVTDLKENLVIKNLKTYWVSKFVQKNKFYNWLYDAKDW